MMVARHAFTLLGGGLLAAMALGPLALVSPAYATADGCSRRPAIRLQR